VTVTTRHIVLRKLVPALAVALVVSGALAGCRSGGDGDVRVQGGGTGGDVKTESASYTVDGGVRTISLEGRVGNIAVRAKDGPISVTERARYADTKPLTSHDQNGDTLELREQSCPYRKPNALCQVDWDITAPAGTVLELETGVGNIKVAGTGGKLIARAATGDVNADDLASGDVSATSSTGSVELAFTRVPDEVSADASVGDVRITLPGDVAYATRVSTSVGDKQVEVRQDPTSSHRVRAKSSVGDVEIRTG
jgi:DUF4097 and DUF4098 domain-containing protein YvlB